MQRPIENQEYVLNDFGCYIRKLRKAQGWSTAKLSEISGLSAGLINQLENGESKKLPKLNTLKALMTAFSVDFADLKGRNYSTPFWDIYELLRVNNKLNDLEHENNAQDWQTNIRSVLVSIGFDPAYAHEALDYIKTLKIKQDIALGNADLIYKEDKEENNV